jgi:ABC-2 type transport system permease protein
MLQLVQSPVKTSVTALKISTPGSSWVEQMVGAGLALGVNVASGILGALVIFVLAALFGIAWSGISLFVALNTKNAETTLSVGLLTTFPLLFLSASVMPLGLLPSWVQQVAKVNPFTYIAKGYQSLIIRGFLWDSIAYAFMAILIIGIISLGASILVFRKKISSHSTQLNWPFFSRNAEIVLLPLDPVSPEERPNF